MIITETHMKKIKSIFARYFKNIINLNEYSKDEKSGQWYIKIRFIHENIVMAAQSIFFDILDRPESYLQPINFDKYQIMTFLIKSERLITIDNRDDQFIEPIESAYKALPARLKEHMIKKIPTSLGLSVSGNEMRGTFFNTPRIFPELICTDQQTGVNTIFIELESLIGSNQYGMINQMMLQMAKVSDAERDIEDAKQCMVL